METTTAPRARWRVNTILVIAMRGSIGRWNNTETISLGGVAIEDTAEWETPECFGAERPEELTAPERRQVTNESYRVGPHL